MRLNALQDRFALTSIAILIAGLLTGQGTLRDFVLCLGVDGHVAIEAAPNALGTCEIPSTSEMQRQSAGPTKFDGLAQHCGPCQDLMLAEGKVDLFSDPLRPYSGSPTHNSPIPASLLAFETDSCLVKLFSPASPRTKLPTILRSTIVLI